MKKLSKILVLATWVIATSSLSISSASAAVSLGVEVAGTYGLGSAGTPAVTGALGFPGGGVQLDFGLGSRVDLSLQGYYLTRVYSNPTSQAMSLIDGEVVFDIYLARALAVQLGGFYKYALTNPQSLSGTAVGVMGGLHFDFPLAATLGLILDAKYEYGLTSQTYTGGTITPSEVLVAVGFRFGMKGAR